MRRNMAYFVVLLFIASSYGSIAKAQFSFEFGDGDLQFNVWPACLYDKPRAGDNAVRANARASGYHRIRNVVYHGRKFNNEHRCGFYRATAVKHGRRFVIYADADSGELLGVRRLGRADHHKQVSEAQVRRNLRANGYRRIRNIRFVERKNREFYIARARKKQAVYRVFVDPRNGTIVRTRRLKPDHATKVEVRAELRKRGYRKIRNLRYVDRKNREYWVARAEKRGTDYRVFADPDTGRPERRVRLESERASPRDARRSLRAAGFSNIRNLRFVDRGQREFFVARADRRNASYRVFLDAEDAEIVRMTQVK